jgi:hypothetical protein
MVWRDAISSPRKEDVRHAPSTNVAVRSRSWVGSFRGLLRDGRRLHDEAERFLLDERQVFDLLL